MAKAWHRWPGALTPLRPFGGSRGFLSCTHFFLILLHISVHRHSGGDILNGAWRAYRLTDAAQTENAGTHTLIALAHTHARMHTCTHTRTCRHTMKIPKNRNNEKVKVEIHQMDLFVLYNMVCRFALDRQPLRDFSRQPSCHNIPPATMYHIMSHKGAHTVGHFHWMNFEYISLKSGHYA